MGAVTIKVTNLDAIKAAFNSVPDHKIEAGVKVTGEAAAYALVWEWGYATRVIQPGPKTMWGVNPAGEPKVLTLTAPTGYIRVGREQYRQAIKDEVHRSKMWLKPLKDWEAAATEILNTAVVTCAQVISDAAPIDTGDLRSSIIPANVGDPILADYAGAVAMVTEEG